LNTLTYKKPPKRNHTKNKKTEFRPTKNATETSRRHLLRSGFWWTAAE